jgi:hypothetical protein
MFCKYHTLKLCFELSSILTFVSGVVLGSFIVFLFYIEFFKIESKADYLLRNMNTIIGSITGAISIVTLFNIVRFYFS